MKQNYDDGIMSHLKGLDEWVITRAFNAGKKTIDSLDLRISNCGGKTPFQQVSGGVCTTANLIDYFGSVRDKRILDIGCGSYEQKIGCYSSSDGHLPWNSRVLAFAGANVDGIDIGSPLKKEPYNHITSDLLKNSLLALVQRNHYDAALCTSFFDSPILQRLITDRNEQQRFRNILIQEIAGALKQEGVLFVDFPSPLTLAEVSGLEKVEDVEKYLNQVMGNLGFRRLENRQGRSDSLIKWRKIK